MMKLKFIKIVVPNGNVVARFMYKLLIEFYWWMDYTSHFGYRFLENGVKLTNQQL